jgi:P27 family predicted phage terminase small subunit
MKIPKNLKTAGRNFWKNVQKEYEFVKSHDFELLSQAAECVDRMQQCREIVERDGMFQLNRNGNTVESPALKIEKDQKRLFLSIIRELGLTLAPQNPQKGRLY